MDSRGPAHLGEPSQRLLHVEGGHNHEVCQFVYDYDEVRHLLCLGYLGVETTDVSGSGAGHHLVPAVHFLSDPFEGPDNFVHVHDYRRGQVWNCTEGNQLDALGVYHDELYITGPVVHEQAGNEGGYADALAATGGAGNEQVRQCGKVAHDHLARAALAEGHG